MTSAERLQRFLDLAAESIANAERDTIICGREFHLTMARSCLSAARDLCGSIAADPVQLPIDVRSLAHV